MDGEEQDFVIEARKLRKDYGDVVAVRGVDLAIRRGELFGLLGPNGSGKTTIIRLLTGQVPPTSGSIRVMGIDAAASPVEARTEIGIIPEQETPPSFLTAEEYLRFVGEIRHVGDIEEQCDWWFSFLDFDDARTRLCKDLSRGTRQKLMVAQAFLHRPPLALIDEPLINLDPVMQRRVKDFLMDYVSAGNTVFLSTHILAIAEEICTGIAILNRGDILFTGSPAELRDRHEDLEGFFLSLVSGSGE
ncbi:ABC transporter ATP-binding protein [Methanomicrobiaceae archaeon CYW5]|uniref:ABC transporter ATP-binding protein n=1 Tax=Methanovulcanius yangii TaxID=1789227 RepID=UPI0029CA1AC1|nr:ABC transporter ATP-binding protein [Methanovulcanius yangii]MBT8508417.1 ABC transporter ATP-binding protein [Methanovulcanius yangii]